MAVVFHRIAIIGLGLIGSSIARAARRFKVCDHIVGSDVSASALTFARAQSIIDEASADAQVAVKGCDLVILATPPSAMGNVAARMASDLRRGCMLMDTASVKAPVMKSLGAKLPVHCDYIPAHPLAGSEETGISAGDAEMFKGRRVILTPNDPLEKHHMQTANGFWTGLGARVEAMPAPLHDHICAYTSHLPHLLSFASAQIVGSTNKNLEKFLRLSRSRPDLWSEIFLLNSQNMTQALGRYLDILVHVQDELESAPKEPTADSSNDVNVEGLFARIAASCLISAAAEAERSLPSISFGRYTGTGFADFTSPAASEPETDIAHISGAAGPVAALLARYADILKIWQAGLKEGHGNFLENTRPAGSYKEG